MLKREQRISIQDFVSTWLIKDWERPLLHNSVEESMVHCTRIEVKRIDAPPQIFQAKYVCFTDMRTLVVDASAIKSFGEGADPSSLLMQDLSISDPLFREKHAAKVVSLGRPGSILSDQYHYGVLLDDEKRHFTLTSGKVKDVKLAFVHLSAVVAPAAKGPTAAVLEAGGNAPPTVEGKHKVSRRLDITFHDGSGLTLFPSELESVAHMVKFAARLQPLVIADAPRERPLSLVEQEFSAAKSSLSEARRGLESITGEARGLLEKAEDDEITSRNRAGLLEALIQEIEEHESAVTGEATQASTAQHAQKQLWEEEWRKLKGQATEFDERFNVYIQGMESDIKIGLKQFRPEDYEKHGLEAWANESLPLLPKFLPKAFDGLEAFNKRLDRDGQVYDNYEDLPYEDGIGHGRAVGVGVGGPVPPPPPPSPPPEPPPPPFSTPPPRFEVMLEKPEARTSVGIVLAGQPAVINAIRPDTMAAKSGQLKVGQVLLAVNGENITSHEDGGAALKAAVGPLKLSVSASAAAPPTAAPQPPPSGGAATKSARKSMGAMASAALSKIGSIANETPGMSAKESVLSKVGSTANETPDGQSPSDIPRAAAPVATATPIAPNQPRVRAAAPNLGREPEDSGAAEPPKPAFREAQAEKRRQAIKDAQPLKEKEECDLLEAAARGDEASVLLLLNSNTGIDIRGPTGWTALMAACYANRLAVAKILLGRGAALDATSKRGLTAFDLARERKHTEVVGLLKEVAKQRGMVLQSARPSEALWRAAEAGDANEVKQLILHKRAQVDARMPETGKTALHVACALGHVDTASTLLEQRAKLEMMAANGDTPLLLASVSGHLSVVKMLLAKGAEVDHKNKQGYQAIDLAQKAGHKKVVLCLEDAQKAAALGAPRVLALKETETRAVTQLRAQLLLTNDKLDLSALRSATIVVASKQGQTDEVKEARARNEDVRKGRHMAASKMRYCSSQPFAYTDDGLLHRLIGEARSIGVGATEVKRAEERLHFLLELRKFEAKTLQRVDERLRKLKAAPHGQEAQLQQMVDMAVEETKQTVQDRLVELQSKIDNHPNRDDPLFGELLEEYKEQKALKGRFDKAFENDKVREFYSLCSETMKSSFAAARMLLRDMDNKADFTLLAAIKKTDKRSQPKALSDKAMDSTDRAQGVAVSVQDWMSSPIGAPIVAAAEKALAGVVALGVQEFCDHAPELVACLPGAQVVARILLTPLVKALKRRKAGQLMVDMRHVTTLAAKFPASLPGGGYEALCEQAALQIAEDLKEVIMAKKKRGSARGQERLCNQFRPCREGAESPLCRGGELHQLLRLEAGSADEGCRSGYGRGHRGQKGSGFSRHRGQLAIAQVGPGVRRDDDEQNHGRRGDPQCLARSRKAPGQDRCCCQ